MRGAVLVALLAAGCGVKAPPRPPDVGPEREGQKVSGMAKPTEDATPIHRPFALSLSKGRDPDPEVSRPP